VKRILITGASGFIGSFEVEKALKKQYHVVAGIRELSSKKYLQDKRIEFLNLNFSNKKDLKAQLASLPTFDFIIHNAGIVKAVNPSAFYDFNVDGSCNFVEALRETDRVPQKYTYISSIASFGPGKKNGEAISVNDAQNPITEYGRSKLEAETYLRSLNDFPWTIINPTGVYGPREEHFLMMIKLINRHLQINIGRQNQNLSFIYVKDLVNAIFQSLESDLVHRQYLISDGRKYNSNSFSEITKAILEKKTIPITIPMWAANIVASISENYSKISNKASIISNDKIKELRALNWQCDITPAMDELGFNPEYNLQTGLKETIDWYMYNDLL